MPLGARDGPKAKTDEKFVSLERRNKSRPTPSLSLMEEKFAPMEKREKSLLFLTSLANQHQLLCSLVIAFNSHPPCLAFGSQSFATGNFGLEDLPI
jgi:hypothetical protein